MTHRARAAQLAAALDLEDNPREAIQASMHQFVREILRSLGRTYLEDGPHMQASATVPTPTASPS